MKKVPEDLAAKLYGVGDRFLAAGDSARLDEVAEEVGIARATLYYYFSGKDDMVTFFAREKLSRVGAAVQESKAADGTASERFEGALFAAAQELSANPALCLQLMAAHGRREAMADVTAAAEVAVMAPLRELLIEARADGDVNVADVGLTVASIVGGINKAIIQQWVTTDQVDPEVIADVITAVFLNGIRSR